MARRVLQSASGCDDGGAQRPSPSRRCGEAAEHVGGATVTGLRSPNAGSLFGSLVATVHKHAPLQRALFPRSASQQPRATKARGTGRMLLCAPDAARGWSLLSASPCAGGQRGGHKESPALRPAIQSAPSLLTRAAPAARRSAARAARANGNSESPALARLGEPALARWRPPDPCCRTCWPSCTPGSTRARARTHTHTEVQYPSRIWPIAADRRPPPRG